MPSVGSFDISLPCCLLNLDYFLFLCWKHAPKVLKSLSELLKQRDMRKVFRLLDLNYEVGPEESFLTTQEPIITR